MEKTKQNCITEIDPTLIFWCWSLSSSSFAKGQIISKCLFGVFNFFQKMNKQILLYYYETSGRLVFVRFLEEVEDTKKTFRNYLTFSKWRFIGFYNTLRLWGRIMAKKIGDKSCQSNFDKRSSDFGSFLEGGFYFVEGEIFQIIREMTIHWS